LVVPDLCRSLVCILPASACFNLDSHFGSLAGVQTKRTAWLFC
jgi:hypothetical protein